MRLTERTEIAIHIIKKLLEKNAITQFKDLLPSTVYGDDTARGILTTLIKDGVVMSRKGRDGGYIFCGYETISAWDVACMVESDINIENSYVGTLLRTTLKKVLIADLIDSEALCPDQ
jgi:DNA-binding IscR family transcriptional regulator